MERYGNIDRVFFWFCVRTRARFPPPLSCSRPPSVPCALEPAFNRHSTARPPLPPSPRARVRLQPRVPPRHGTTVFVLLSQWPRHGWFTLSRLPQRSRAMEALPRRRSSNASSPSPASRPTDSTPSRRWIQQTEKSESPFPAVATGVPLPLDPIRAHQLGFFAPAPPHHFPWVTKPTRALQMATS
jgi:hypothetical protein